MSAKRGQTNPATKDLWRVAETDDIDRLPGILAKGADINASNDYGMTALMRAASRGRVEMVRALIAHGADPNATRNDQFTPLMLAAFFGHTDVVRTLVQHGAETNAVTRFGTSAPTWAKARTFDKVARYLEDGSGSTDVTRRSSQTTFLTPDCARSIQSDETCTAPVTIADVVIDSRSLDHNPQATVSPPVVRTLKDPPEIWDLVQEVPRHFDARSAFLSRIKSINPSLPLIAISVLLLIAGSALAFLTLRDSRASNDNHGQELHRGLSHSGATTGRRSVSDRAEEKSLTSSASESENSVLDDAARSHHVGPGNVRLDDVSKSAAPTRAGATVLSDGNTKRRLARGVRVVTENRSPLSPGKAAEVIVSSSEVPASPRNASAQSHLRTSPEATVRRKGSTPLSSQLIAPATGSQSRAKVIQWP